MSTTWTPAFDVLQGSAQRLSQARREMSGGRFRIEVFPGGQIMPPFECFDAASKGTIEAFMAARYYWADEGAGAQWFATVPFGMNSGGMAAWFHQGDGLKLMGGDVRVPSTSCRARSCRPGPQMAGWFRKKINTIADYKGLKMRIAGPRRQGRRQGGRRRPS